MWPEQPVSCCSSTGREPAPTCVPPTEKASDRHSSDHSHRPEHSTFSFTSNFWFICTHQTSATVFVGFTFEPCRQRSRCSTGSPLTEGGPTVEPRVLNQVKPKWFKKSGFYKKTKTLDQTQKNSGRNPNSRLTKQNYQAKLLFWKDRKQVHLKRFLKQLQFCKQCVLRILFPIKGR